MRLRVVVGQLEIGWELSRNRAEIVSFLRAEAAAGSVVVLPEAAVSGYDDELSGLAGLDQRELAESLAAVAAAARDRGVHLLCGSLLPWRDSWSNTALYFGPAGESWIYRKVNLATHERGRLAAGDSLPLLRLQTRPAPVAIGVQLCRELKYPEQWHVLARDGAQLLAYLTYAANPRIVPGVWRSHLISRAAENQRFVLAANVASPVRHCPTMVVSPRGEVLAEAVSPAAQALHAEIDLAEVSGRVLAEQRADVVGISDHGTGDVPWPEAGFPSAAS